MNFLLDLLDCLVRLIRWLFGLFGASHSENVPQPDPPSSPSSSSPPLLREKSSFILTPDTDDRSCTALQNLQQGLKRYRLESCVDRHLEFVAGPIVQRLVEDNIKAILDEGSLGDVEHISSHCQLISKHATRLFAIFVELKREEYIISLLKDGIQDDNLPFQRVQTSAQHTMVLVTRQGRNVHALKDWDNEAIKNLEKKQYRVLSPIFRRGEHYELDDLHILPFLDHEADHEGKASAAGGYGEVFRACIHPDNHELEHSSVRPRRGLFVAVKLLFHNDDFQPERNVYRALGHLSHDHLIDLLFTYKRKDRYHLVFPWADGSLKDYWEKYPKPAFTHQNLIWSVEQMKGIASGLAYFHEFTNPEHGQTRFGRHGDIKAQNILWFRHANILKIADLGLASVHGIDSRSNVPPSTVVASPTYSPPELRRKHPVSRKWDIWSLGCLCLEFVTYLVLGNAAIVEFSSQRKGRTDMPEMTSDVFYSEDAQEVNPGVISWVAHLRNSQQCSRAMHDILNLVMDEMLVVDPDARSDSGQIFMKMKELIKNAKEEKKYLLKSEPLALRHSRRPPRIFGSLIQPQPLSTAPRSRTWGL